MKTFYKACHFFGEEGSVVYFKEFKQLHETECYAYCLEDSNMFIARKFSATGKQLVSAITRSGYRLVKIHKGCSRFAFESKDKAFEHFKMLKARQINHLERDLKTYKSLVESIDSKSLSDLTKYSFGHGSVLISQNKQVILESFRFD